MAAHRCPYETVVLFLYSMSLFLYSMDVGLQNSSFIKVWMVRNGWRIELLQL